MPQVAFRGKPLRIECARVGGVEIPNQKYLEFSLQYIYGIGHTTSKAIISATVSFLRCVCGVCGWHRAE